MADTLELDALRGALWELGEGGAAELESANHELPPVSALEAGLLEAELAQLAPVALPPSNLRERLLRSVEQAPLRYAPFFGRAAELLDLSESEVEREFARMQDRSSWRFAGLPGIECIFVAAGKRVAGAEVLFVRCKPGAALPHHHHVGAETVLLLEGGYRDDGGVAHHAGDVHHMAPGTAHGVQAFDDEGCIFVSVAWGRRFESWPLRLIAKVFGH
jgi:ChrR Cupin-like domain